MVTDELSEQDVYASNASIASIERGLQSRELDKTLLAVYPFTIEARRALEGARLEAQGIMADLLGDLGTSVETVRTKVGEAPGTQNH